MKLGSVILPEPEEAALLVEEWKAADPALSRALQPGVDPIKALAKLGVRLCMQNRYPEALTVLSAAVSLSPNDPELLNNLAVALERNRHVDAAMRVVEHSLSLSHAQPDSWLFLANMRREKADLAGAQAAYEAALLLDPASSIALQGLGLVYQSLRNYPAAIQCFKTCIQQTGPLGPLLAILGQFYYECGQFENSRNAYAEVIACDELNPICHQMHRETQFICAAIHGEPIEDALQAYLADLAAFPAPYDKNVSDLLRTTFSILVTHNYKNAARRVGETRVARFPSATARYLLQALAGEASVTRSPDAYLVECFDDFADRFDDHLVNTLGYDVPRKLVGALDGLLSPGPTSVVLDAGCGTGLCGPLIRPFASSLTGVDLSPKMLGHAQNRGIYDRLACEELTAFLTQSPAAFDVVLSADVLIYFGDLTRLADALAASLKSGGLLAVSTESAERPGHQFLTSGRFAHHPDCVRSAFGASFTLVRFSDITVRMEIVRPVRGNIFVFRRR